MRLGQNRCVPCTGQQPSGYDIRGEPIRLLTNMPYLCEEIPVALTRKFYFGLTWGLGIEDDLINPGRAGLEASLFRGPGSDSGSTGIEGKWEVRGLSRKTAVYNFNVTSQDSSSLRPGIQLD